VLSIFTGVALSVPLDENEKGDHEVIHEMADLEGAGAEAEVEAPGGPTFRCDDTFKDE